MRPFHEWIADMSNSIEDASEFSKDLSNATNNDILQRCFHKAIKNCPIPMLTDDDVIQFHNMLIECFYDEIFWKEYDDAETNEEHVDWFVKLKNKIFDIKG